MKIELLPQTLMLQESMFTKIPNMAAHACCPECPVPWSYYNFKANTFKSWFVDFVLLSS